VIAAAASPTLWTGPLEYRLPPELIAQTPPARREDARLMVVDRREARLHHRAFADVADLLRPGDLLVANDSQVVPARLLARKDSGGRVDLLVLPPPRGSRIEALARSSKALRAGASLALDDGSRIEVVAASGGRCLLEFGRDPMAALEHLGRVPLPPYIRAGEEGPGDRERYQTVYAREPGSVAAPTAGLHFTPDILAALERRGVEFRTVTLHVGPGTFTPVRGAADAHVMEAERVYVTPGLAGDVERTRRRGGRLVAVGTTSVRALETAADPARPQHVRPFEGETSLFLRPGRPLRVCDALFTNFHLPHSTLLCLVMAFAGEDLVRRAYEAAVRERYRFYSYGDAMLVV
jgi:S-adenosylmethionine:tRNA ribosyltransferase-isomerase